VYPLGPFYTGDIATDLVPDAETLADLTFGEERRPPGQRTHAWNAAGRAIRAAARAGIVHADLNLRNVLVAWRSGVPSPYLLDLDRCRIVRRASPHDLAVMSRRLRRSAQRFEERTGLRLVNEFAAFEDGFRA
jgi:Ser/Thr protein kinase RdoA (MazF antagonist)